MRHHWEMQAPEEFQSQRHEEFSRMLEKFNSNYRHILPKKRVFMAEPTNQTFVNPKVCLELIEQFEITIQLLVQNILFCEDINIKNMSAQLLQDVINKKNQRLSQLFLPAYTVCLSDFVTCILQEI
jgi:hypothetical protein